MVYFLPGILKKEIINNQRAIEIINNENGIQQYAQQINLKVNALNKPRKIAVYKIVLYPSRCIVIIKFEWQMYNEENILPMYYKINLR